MPVGWRFFKIVGLAHISSGGLILYQLKSFFFYLYSFSAGWSEGLEYALSEDMVKLRESGGFE